MGKKTQLKQVLERLNTTLETKENVINEVRNSESYTDKGKRELIGQYQEEVDQLIETSKEIIIGMLEEAKNGVLKVEALKGGEYQTRLSNALKLIEYGGDELTKEELQQTLEEFKNDKMAVVTLRGALLKGGKDKITVNEILPLKNTLSNADFIEKIKINVKTYFASGASYGGFSGINMVINGMIQALDRLDENFVFID